MNESDNILPLKSWDELQKEREELSPTFLKDDEWFGIDVSADLLDFTEPYKPPRWTLKRGDIPFANVGDLHIISGKSGHGKTNFMSQIIATILSGKFGGTEYTKPSTVNTPVILYIDTEQGKDDTIAFKNRVCTMANIDYSKPNESFHILRLRETEKASDRWKKILQAIWMLRPTDVFLDGMLDIVNDYNDQNECNPIIRKCMTISTHYDTSMWLVLHENPMADKMVGTLGSITERKVSEVFCIKKHKQSDEKQRVPNFPEIYFEVKQLKARGRDIPSWFFEVIPNANGWGMPVELDSTGVSLDLETVKMQQDRIEANDYLMHFNWSRNGSIYTEIERYLRSKGITSNRKIEKILNTALEAGIINKNSKGKYFYNGLDKKAPNDTPEDLAFEKPDGDEVVPY